MTKSRTQALFIGPAVAYLTVFFLLPLILMVLISFTTRGAYGQTIYHFTLDNYKRFADGLYLTILGRTVLFSLGTTLVCLALSYPLALFIAARRPTLRDRLLILLMIPFWSNFLVRTYAWVIILRTEGLINKLLLATGLINTPLDLLYNQGAVAVGYIYTWLPFMVLPLYVSVEHMDRRLIEAAQDLGAKPMSIFFRIIVPLTSPGAVAGVLLVLIPALGMFAITDLMGGARTMMLGNLIQNQFGAARNWQFGSAASSLLLVMTMVVLWMLSKPWARGSSGSADPLAEGGRSE